MTTPAIGVNPAVCHAVAWYQTGFNNSSLTKVNNITEQVLTPNGTQRYQVPQGLNLVRAAILAGTGTAVTINAGEIHTPTLDQGRGTPRIIPFVANAVLLTVATPEVCEFSPPLALTPGENIELQVANSGAQTVMGVVFLTAAALPPIPNGLYVRLRATGATTLVAGAWTAVPLTLANALPPGQYALIRLWCESATALAARVLFQGGGFRPGVPAVTATEAGAGAITWAWQRQVLQSYDMGHFTDQTVPQIEFFASAGDTAEVVYLDLIKLA